ncbi:hypothetical protein LSAT2_016935, partial [Lamellibrachia satsuma]
MYLPKPEYWQQQQAIRSSTAPRHDDPLATHQLSYLSGGGGGSGSGKTTTAIELFRNRDPMLLTPIHRLAKEM